MNLWDGDVWSFVLTLSMLFAAMIAATILRNTFTPVRKALIPSSVLGGFLLLFANFIARQFFGRSLYSTSVLEILTYHGLGLGFSALALRRTVKKTDDRSRTGAFDSGVAVVNGYLLQAILGLGITLGLSYVIGNFAASGLLLPMGYGQGPGQAYNWGHNYEALYGFEGGTSFGLTVAAMGFCFRLSVPSLFSLCVAGYAVEHIAYHVAKIVQTLTGLFVGASLGALEDWELMELVVFPPVYLIALGTIGHFAAKNECWKKTDLRFNALSIAVVFICVGLTRLVNSYGEEHSIPVSIYAITCCVMSLVVQFVLYRTVDLRMENTALNLMWQEERKQYELSKKTIDTINIKYHDLKHKLRDMRLPEEEVESIKDAVRIYGSRIRTGSEALDVLLTENSLRCSEAGIRLTYMGNGADLSF